jgi:hypothetical protein
LAGAAFFAGTAFLIGNGFLAAVALALALASFALESAALVDLGVGMGQPSGKERIAMANHRRKAAKNRPAGWTTGVTDGVGKMVGRTFGLQPLREERPG